MEELCGKSMDLTEENLNSLKQLLPEVFTGGKIDFEKLRLVLGDEVDDNEERYEFIWNGKNNAIRIAQTPSTGTLRPDKESSKNWDDTENLYIEGDNLEVLKLLQKSYFGKVKMIYIDPPYNTGKDFVYHDNFRDNIANYKDITNQTTKANPETNGRYHTNWLNMMYPRLKLARNLLREDGVIFISIDDNEVNNLKKMCDEIFGESNFIANIIWQSATDNNPRQISIEHEYIMCYCKSLENQGKWLIESSKAKLIESKYLELKGKYNDINDIQSELKIWIKNNESSLKGVSHYSYVDNIGVYYPGNSSNTKPGGYMFDIIHPITKKICKKPEFGYRWPEKTFLQAAKRGDVDWGNDENTIPKIKKRIDTVTEMLKSYYYEDNRYWTKYMTNLMGKKVFENPKSVYLLERLIKFTTGPDSIVLDFFSGSSSTADAIMNINLQDNSECKFIMVQLPELTDEKSEAYKAGYKNICEIGKERIRRAGDKIVSENKDKEGIENLDIGFKVFKLDSSNLKSWDSSIDNLEQNLLDMESNLKQDRTNEDLLYEILLKSGVELTAKIDEIKVGYNTLYNIGQGALLACLDDKITQDVIDEIPKHKSPFMDTKVIFKEAGFMSDAAKINAVQNLKQFKIEDVRSV